VLDSVAVISSAMVFLSAKMGGALWQNGGICPAGLFAGSGSV